MNDILGNLQQSLTQWAHKARDAGWLNADAVERLGDSEISTPGTLFDAAERPLVIALFGGTGVGKSTLLNRLAQSPIARASAERPTSRDITVYVHESVTVSRLPEEFPMAQMRTSIHQRESWRNVMWVDMPDFDSVETGNRSLVEQWLPHVDVLLYVVSPERYRDDDGWQLLLEHGRRHAWLFAMNHWDRGEQSQIDDFEALLRRAGLSAPLIFRTDSSGDATEDDFPALESAIKELADNQFIRQLEQRGVVQRLEELKGHGEALRERLGDPVRLTALSDEWQTFWQRESATLESSLQFKIPRLAEQYARSGDSPLTRFLPRRPGLTTLLPQGKSGTSIDQSLEDRPPHEPARADIGTSDGAALMDRTALSRIESSLERFLQDAVTAEVLPMRSAQTLVSRSMQTLDGTLSVRIQDRLNRSLSKPGHAVQRGTVQVLGWLSILLPLGAMGWIAYRVVNGFVEGGSQPGQYLGTNFAINSGLLLALAWGAPALLRYRLRPSMEKAASRGLQSGLQEALHDVEQTVMDQLRQTATEQNALLGDYDAVWAAVRSPAGEDAVLPERFRRLLLEPSNGVRATTQS